MDTPPIQQFSELLDKPQTRYINMLLPSVASFEALFVANAAPHPLFQGYIELGAKNVACSPWTAVGAAGDCFHREVSMIRILEGGPQKVVQNVHWWQLNPSNSLVRVRTGTPEWYRAKEVVSIEYLLISVASGTPKQRAAMEGPPAAAAGSGAASLLLTLCYDLEIRRSGLGLFIPVEYAK